MSGLQHSPSEPRGELRRDEPLARHTSWRVGGPARCFYRPANAADLAVFLRGLDLQEPMLWLGLGSNLLVSDEGFAGTVVQTQGCLSALERGRAQPIGLPSCGSVFRNPPRDHAARLIEAAGLKGVRQGGAQVSEKHANFIINTGDVSAGDIARLIARVQSEVERTSGVRLIPEVRRVGG